MLLPSWKTKLPFPKPAAKTLFGDERNVLTARLAALLKENHRLLRELASIRAECDALERARRCMRWDEIKRENRPKLDRGNGE